MRGLAFFALAMSLLACSTSGGPTATPPITPDPTVVPTASPEATPSVAPTLPPTATPSEPPGPTPTPDPDATPTPSPIDVLPYLSSEVTVVNLAAAMLSVTVTLVDTASPDEYTVGTFELQPEQTTSQLILPSRFRLDFEIGGSAVATCTIDIADGEELQFAVIESGAVITTSGGEPPDAAEMIVATASRCRAGTDQ